MQADYTYVTEPQIHRQRKKDILAKYPEIKKLMGPNPMTMFHIALCVGLQWLAAYLLQDASWWIVVLVAYVFGAFPAHALYVLTHEACHNLVFKGRFWNKWAGIACDFGLGLPGAISFRQFHMIHHRHLGEYEMDPDIVSHTEAKLVGNSPLRKALWLMLFGLSQALRPLKVQNAKVWNKWVLVNFVTVIGINAAIYSAWGGKALAYIFISTFFALGLHPLGGRWIQEHYVTKEGQETYNYQGPLNKFAYNIGFHNEHHDLMNIPWNKLPEVSRTAPEFYDHLHIYRSWTWVVKNFIFNPKMSSYSRVVHPSTLNKRKKEMGKLSEQLA